MATLRNLAMVGTAAIYIGAHAADLVVSAGDSQTISANATYDTITVDGSLTIDSAATVNATMVYVGHDGATGLVTVTGGATLTVPTTIDQGVFLGSITAGSSSAAGRGRLVMENGYVNGNVYASRNCISNGTTKATSPTNEVWLGEGSVFTGNVHHYADPPLRLAYAGGRQVCVGKDLLHVYDYSDTFVDSVDGNAIRLDCNNNHITYPNAGQYGSATDPFQPHTCVYFRGAGDFIREGLPNAVKNPLHLGGYDAAQMENWTAFTGRIVADGGGIRFFSDNQVDSADAEHPREWVARNGGFISFDRVPHNLGSFTGGGFLTNHAASAGTLNAHVAGTETWDVRTPLVKFRKYNHGSLTVNGPSPSSVDVLGGTFTLGGRESNCWTHYRFKVDRVLTNGSDMRMQISEFKLLDGDTDVTTPYAAITSGGPVDTSEGAIKAVDGSVDTKWCCNSSTNEYWIALKYANPLRVTRYQWYSANDAISAKDENNIPTKTYREPIDWRVQGSLDGVAWYDLDVQTDFSPTPLRKTLSADFTLGDDTGLIADFHGSEPVPVTVCTGTTYAVGANRDAKFAKLLNFGTVGYGQGSDFVCGTDGNNALYLNPAYSGTGDFVKEGAATSFVHGVSALTGAVRVTSGTLALTGLGCPLKYWRFTAKNIVTGGDGLFQLGEIDLRAVDGTRVNANLSVAVATVTSASALAAGTASLIQGHGYRAVSSAESVAKLFDGDWATKCCIQTKNSSSSSKIKPAINDPDSWVIVVFRLADNAKMPVAYHLVSGSDALGKRNPDYWSLEASADGVNWITVDETAGATTPMANSAIFNDGVPYAISNYTGIAAAHFPNASDVVVSSGATLLLAPAGSTLSSLTVDCTGGNGTVSGFTPAVGGTLNLVNVVSYSEVRQMDALPITLENPGDMSALSTWTVRVNGEPIADKVRFSRGALALKVRGMTIILK